MHVDVGIYIYFECMKDQSWVKGDFPLTAVLFGDTGRLLPFSLFNRATYGIINNVGIALPLIKIKM